MGLLEALYSVVQSLTTGQEGRDKHSSTSSSSSMAVGGGGGGEISRKLEDKLNGYFDLAKKEIDRAVRAEEWGLPSEAIPHYKTAHRILSEGLQVPLPSSSCSKDIKDCQAKLLKWQGNVYDRLQYLEFQTGHSSNQSASNQALTQPPMRAKQSFRSNSQKQSSIVSGHSSNQALSQPPMRAKQPLHSNSQKQRFLNTSKNLSKTSVPVSSSATSHVNKVDLKGIDSQHMQIIESTIVDKSPAVKWDDIAGLTKAKQALREMVILPMKRKDLFTGLRKPARGLLLFGPPGNGKTMLAKAVASEAACTFFSVAASSLTSKWVGEAEKLMKTLFSLAAAKQPSVIFIDEIDSIMSTRTSNENEASRRLKSEFLIQFDGVLSNPNDHVILMGATNRPQELDDAVLRRLVKRIYIPLPDIEVRRSLLKRKLQGHSFAIPVSDLERLVLETDGYSGSDLQALCEEAAMVPIRELGFKIESVKANEVRPMCFADFKEAMKVIRPSVSKVKLVEMEQWNEEFGSS